jgi:hypothetical protein
VQNQEQKVIRPVEEVSLLEEVEEALSEEVEEAGGFR